MKNNSESFSFVTKVISSNVFFSSYSPKYFEKNVSIYSSRNNYDILTSGL